MVAASHPQTISKERDAFRPENAAFRASVPHGSSEHGCSWHGGSMASNSRQSITFSRHFLQPANVNQRQYEALRAYFVEGLPSAEAAKRFGYTPGSFRVLTHQFRRNPSRPFFLPSAREAGRTGSRTGCGTRSSRCGSRTSPSTISAGRSPGKKHRSARRQSRPFWTKKASPSCRDGVTRSDPISLVRRSPTPPMFASSISPHGTSAPTSAACSCFCPIWLRPLDAILRRAGFPGSKMIPAGCAMRSLLALEALRQCPAQPCDEPRA